MALRFRVSRTRALRWNVYRLWARIPCIGGPADVDTSGMPHRLRNAGTCRRPSRDPIPCGARISTFRKARRAANVYGSDDPLDENSAPFVDDGSKFHPQFIKTEP